jgi:hypothetical protein
MQNVPIYAVRSTSEGHLRSAFRTLLGLDPSAGGPWGRAEGIEPEPTIPESFLQPPAEVSAMVLSVEPPGEPEPAIPKSFLQPP